ncbi:uncharacterized membrane protein YgdD (TMEM256/DUF423 family) [Pseudomonas fluvialis]|uniref:Uncharacterized membrane protein YgdD (TMEM256/DUF423 family) n=1 Tax=Pseudomonas fluvialis TaxID=1793966 RepID=A0A7X0BPJ2_9PSED|nr:DUF423 domain-containing protein [Pseudomonas fluvialis]MBB6340390.1 uncharacterized membrane protein YgdD (TMEM256/DUF423 family) [Pseudomonas fluvialis]
MARLFLLLAAFSGFTSVALGAFAAHGLRQQLSPEYLAVFQTGVQYQQLHTLTLLVVALLLQRQPDRLLTLSGGFFVAGMLLFSGSLYALTLTGIGKLGIITPLGGVAFMLGWLLLGVAAWRQR